MRSCAPVITILQVDTNVARHRRTRVEITVVQRQRVNVVEYETVEMSPFAYFFKPGVEQCALVEHFGCQLCNSKDTNKLVLGVDICKEPLMKSTLDLCHSNQLANKNLVNWHNRWKVQVNLLGKCYWCCSSDVLRTEDNEHSYRRLTDVTIRRTSFLNPCEELAKRTVL